jgi:divalent metal cation (Fe/Co/Zn/Cd) transporter
MILRTAGDVLAKAGRELTDAAPTTAEVAALRATVAAVPGLSIFRRILIFPSVR